MIQREIVKFVIPKWTLLMRHIVDYANERIDACSKCQAKCGCEWFQAAKNVVLDIPGEQYAEMTYEERASALHSSIEEPDNDCDQVSFDEMMKNVEALLQTAYFGMDADTLCEQLQLMVQLERRLQRLSPDCRDVFDAPIRAIVERSLGAIDYRFLKMKMDIFSLIENIHGDYHRTKILRQYHIEGVVNVLLAKARKMSVEEIVNYHGDFRNYVPPPPTLKELQDILDSDVLDDLPDLTVKEEGKKTGPKYYGGGEPVKTYVPSLTDTFLGMMNDSQTGDYVLAFTMSFGVDETSFPWDENEIFDTDFIDKHIVPPYLYEFPKMKELAQEIRKEIREHKNDEEQLQLYINRLLYDLRSLGYYLFPSDSDDAHSKLSITFSLAHYYKGYTLKEFSDLWEKAVANAEHEFEFGSEEYYDQIYDNMCMVPYDPLKDTSDRTFTGIAELRDLCSKFEAAIESALLLNNIKHDFMYFERECRAYLGWEVSEDDVAEYAGLTKTAVKRLAKTLGHSFQYEPEQETDKSEDAPAEDDLPFDIGNEKKAEPSVPTMPVVEDKRPKLEVCVPVELITDKSRPYWIKARDEGFLDDEFKYKGQKNEMALFASHISWIVYNEIKWKPFMKWCGYQYFSKAYGEVPSVSPDQLPDNFKKIEDFFK